MENKEQYQRQVGQRIKICRNAKRLTQEELSEKLGLETRSYANIESGARLFSVEVLLKLTNELNVSADYILKGYTESTSPLNDLIKSMTPENVSRVEIILQIFKDAVTNAGNNG